LEKLLKPPPQHQARDPHRSAATALWGAGLVIGVKWIGFVGVVVANDALIRTTRKTLRTKLRTKEHRQEEVGRGEAEFRALTANRRIGQVWNLHAALAAALSRL
jgi:hypothetical protein